MLKPRDEAFKYYFYFIQERMNIFWNRIESEKNIITKDPILLKYKFTNVYRALDRVSQYLISEVIYNQEPEAKEEDILLRIIVFKIFNKIETWQYLMANHGNIYFSTFDPERISILLSQLQRTKPIFSGAYMMTGTHSKYNHLKSKHSKWLEMVKNELIEGDIINQVLKAKSFAQIYSLLRNCSFMGDFIAYQYATDLNYSPYVNFDENTFVKAGIGAIRGIRKCFADLGGMSNEEVIIHVKENFSFYQKLYGYDKFKPLENREMKLIDLQNCFCETDKYLRAKMPQLSLGNKRIKQKYKPNYKSIEYYFPPNWKINSFKTNTSWKLNSTELTLF